MKRFLLPVLALLSMLGVARADGLIIVHEPFPLPHPQPIPPVPWPRPPRPTPLLPPRVYTFAPLEVTFHQVDVKIRDQIATTSVDQEFHNPNDRQLEGTYIFPVPKGAQIDRFSMDVNGQQVQAELLAADKAREIYEDIVRKHRDPALLEYVGRDLFKVRIFPIEPHSKKRVKLSYTQVLKADAGLVSYSYPLNTEKFSARPIPTVSVKIDLETKRPLKSIYSPSHNLEIRRHGDRQATAGFEAKDVKPDTDLQLFFATETGDIGLSLLTYRTGAEDGYFLLLATPAFELKDKKILPKDIAFVLDTSGSMAGAKLDQAKKALLFCIENLNDTDRFEIVRFSTEIEPLFAELRDASGANRTRAKGFVRDLKPIGGTAIHDALKRALALRPGSGDRPFFVIFLTDGLPTVGTVDNDAIVGMVDREGGGRSRVFCFGIGHDVNTHLLDRITETTHATGAYVLPEEDLEVKLSSFFSKIKEPVLANLKLVFPEPIRATKLYPSPLPDLFKGEQLVLAGRYSGQTEAKLALEGSVDGQIQQFAFDVRFPERSSDHDFIPRLWATRRIGFLLDEIRLRGENAELRDEVVALARQYGVVTPYTAYLIHEDEQRRGVPLARQSLPQLREDREALLVTENAYRSFQNDASGQAAVAAARYGLANRSANQVNDFLQLSKAESTRALSAAAPAPVAVPPPARAGRGVTVNSAQPVPLARYAASPAAPATVARAIEYTQQTQFVGGRNFFQNGNQWVDTGTQQLKNPTNVRVQFNSREYFDLLGRHPEARPWLALGQNVVFALGQTVYEVYE